jgi:hypothetical protein
MQYPNANFAIQDPLERLYRSRLRRPVGAFRHRDLERRTFWSTVV